MYELDCTVIITDAVRYPVVNQSEMARMLGYSPKTIHKYLADGDMVADLHSAGGTAYFTRARAQLIIASSAKYRERYMKQMAKRDDAILQGNDTDIPDLGIRFMSEPGDSM